MSPDTHPALAETPADHVGPSLGALRLMAGLLVAPCLALVALFSLSLAGWGFETDPTAQLRRDLPQLLASAVAGAASGAALGLALAGARRVPVGLLALAGTIPAAVMASAYVTTAY
jgi:hypothetical protein